MRRTEAYLPTTRDDGGVDREDVRLARRAGLLRQFGSGLYALTPAGYRVREKIVDRIEAEMRAIGGQRVSLPQLNARAIWDASGRWERFEGEMFTLETRDGTDCCLAPSHEEGIVHLVAGHVRSYDDLPLVLYQVQAKHRDDHARNGLLRTKEFTMKDAYSLHASESSLRRTYRDVRAAYERCFDAIGLDVAICEVDDAVMGGPKSEEFVAPVDDGAVDLVHCTSDGCRFGVTDEHPDYDRYRQHARVDADAEELADTHVGNVDCDGRNADSDRRNADSDRRNADSDRRNADTGDGGCPECETGSLRASEGIEVGHVFQLGTQYSAAMDLAVDTADGDDRIVHMGSYGIGVMRSIQTLIAQHADADGCRWPRTDAGTVAPYEVAIVPLAVDGDLWTAADRLHADLTAHEAFDDRDVLLFDDETQSIGERFAESDLLGIPTKIVLGNHYADTGEVELETRSGRTTYCDVEAVTDAITQR